MTSKNKKSNTRLVKHLKNADFFEVDKYPTASFVIEKVTAKPSDGHTHVFDGKLTIKDITKPFSMPVSVDKQGKIYVIKSKFEFNRGRI